MPTQEEINAAQVELNIANDNYAALADKYNQYNRIFESYKNSSPEAQERASGLMQEALNNYEQLKQQMYAAEDRIAVAQNRVNGLNNAITMQQSAVAQQGGQRRRVVDIPKTNDQLRLEQYLGAGYYIGNDGLMYTPSGVLVTSNGYNINSSGEFIPAAGYMSTANGPQPGTITENIHTPQQYTTPITEMVGGMSTDEGPRMGYIVENITPSNKTPVQLQGVSPDFVYTSGMPLRGVSNRVGRGTLTPRGYVDTNGRGKYQLRGVGNGSGTLLQ